MTIPVHAKSFILEDVKLDGGNTFEELCTWGLQPIRDTLERMDRYYGEQIRETDPEWEFYYYDLRTKVERLDRALQRLEAEALGKKKQEAA